MVSTKSSLHFLNACLTAKEGLRFQPQENKALQPVSFLKSGQVSLLAVWPADSPDANPQAQSSCHLYLRSGLHTVCCHCPLCFCVHWGCILRDSKIFFSGKQSELKSPLYSPQPGEGFHLLSLGSKGGLRSNKGDHFKLDELRGWRLLEALEKSQKVDFLLFNMNVGPACKS